MSSMNNYYLMLERIMIKADENGEEVFADSMRDIMDVVWLQLSNEDHIALNNRKKKGASNGAKFQSASIDAGS